MIFLLDEKKKKYLIEIVATFSWGAASSRRGGDRLLVVAELHQSVLFQVCPIVVVVGVVRIHTSLLVDLAFLQEVAVLLNQTLNGFVVVDLGLARCRLDIRDLINKNNKDNKYIAQGGTSGLLTANEDSFALATTRFASMVLPGAAVLVRCWYMSFSIRSLLGMYRRMVS